MSRGWIQTELVEEVCYIMQWRYPQAAKLHVSITLQLDVW